MSRRKKNYAPTSRNFMGGGTVPDTELPFPMYRLEDLDLENSVMKKSAAMNGKTESPIDCSISVHKTGKLGIVFRNTQFVKEMNGAHVKATRSRDNRRLYFLPSDYGYLITNNGKEGTKNSMYCTMPNSHVFDGFLGNCNLLYDGYLNAWYAEKMQQEVVYA